MNNRLLLVLIGFSFVVMSCSKKVVAPAIDLSPPKPTLNVEEIDFEYMHGPFSLDLATKAFLR